MLGLFLGLSWLFVLLRCYVKAFISKSWAADDFLLIVSAVRINNYLGTATTDQFLDLLHNLRSLFPLRRKVRNRPPRLRHPTCRYSNCPLLLVALRALLHHNHSLHPSLHRCIPPPHSRQTLTPRHNLWHSSNCHRVLPLLSLPRHLPMPPRLLLLAAVCRRERIMHQFCRGP